MHQLIRNYIICFLIILGSHTLSLSQTADTLSTPVKMKIPRNAMIYSAVCPGLGQWYNEQKIKSVIVFGGEAALIGNAVFYNQKIFESKNDLTLSDEDRETSMGFYRDWRGQFIWYAAAFYLLNILDAYVDAHLFSFDVGPNLSENSYINHNVTYSMQFNLPLSSIWSK